VKVRFGGAVGDGTKACPSQHPRGMIFRRGGAAEFEETSSKTQESEETTIVCADDPSRWGSSVVFIALMETYKASPPFCQALAGAGRDLAPQEAFVPQYEVRNPQHQRWKGEGDLSALVNPNQLGFERVI